MQARHLKILAVFFIPLFSFACFNHTEMANNGNVAETPKKTEVTPKPSVEMTDFERELSDMRIADFDYIFVLKRKDGGKFTSEDRAFVRDNKHFASNRSSFIEDDKTLFVGSNYEFTEEGLTALKKRFEFQDFSKSKEQIEKENREAKEKEEKEKEKAQETNKQVEGK